MQNKFVGYVYLVDWAGRIRWAGCGGPWNGDGSIPSPATSEPTLDGPDSSTSLVGAAKRAKETPEGGPLGQISEGLVQGLGEVERLERCTKVLMNRLDTLVAAGELS